MKRIYAYILFIMCVCYTCAQTQQGIVKTRGRMVNGQLVAGQKLAGATITLNFGNALVSGSQGGFSFNVPSGKTYSLVMAKKQGYTLADPEYTRRSFKYSASNPFYVVLEDVNQRQADIKEATDKIRKTLKKELRLREDELDELRETNSITQAKYDSLRIEFSNYRQSSESLVKEMAERYANVDYDQLDDFKRQVQMFIEEGHLLKADSLINTRGSIEERYSRIKEQENANVQREEELINGQELLNKSKQLTLREKEDLMNDLYSKHTIYLQHFQQDSALYCLKMRVNLDTTNYSAIFDYAELCYKQKKFEDCERYYHVCLRITTQQKDVSSVRIIQNALGNLYRVLHDYPNSEKYYKLALESRELLLNQNPDNYLEYLARTQNNLGLLYSDLHDYSNSEKYYKLALANDMWLFNQNPDAYREGLAKTQNNLGLLYSDLHDYSNSEKYYKMALENYEQLFKQNPVIYRANLSSIQNNLAGLYSDLHDYSNSEKYYKLALENKELLFSLNPDAYCADLAMTQNNLGGCYYDLHDYPDCEKYLKSALETQKLLFTQNSDVYREDLARTYWNMMFLYAKMANLEQYDLSLDSALALYKELYSAQPSVYVDTVIFLYNNKVWRLLRKNFIDEAFDLAQVTYAMDESNETSIQYLAECNNSKAYQYANALDFVNAHKSIDKAISMLPNNANFHDFKGEIFLMQGKNKEALEMWKKVMELNPNFLNDFPNGTNLSNGLKKLGLIE